MGRVTLRCHSCSAGIETPLNRAASHRVLREAGWFRAERNVGGVHGGSIRYRLLCPPCRAAQAGTRDRQGFIITAKEAE